MSLINSSIQNNILEAAEQKIESQIMPDNKADYMKIVVGGMKLALAKGPNGILASLKKSKNPINDCAVGAVKLCLMMAHMSRGTMPPKAMVPAGMTLMLHALDFVDKVGLVQIGTPELVKATHIFTNEMFKAFKITPQVLQNAAGKVHAITKDPTQLEILKRRAGMTKDPNAAIPTEVPGETNAV